MSLRVIQIGTDSAWREAAVNGWRKFGVPEGGPFDRESWAWCCALGDSVRAIEIGPFGGIFLAESRVSVALTGAARPVRIADRSYGNGCHTVEPGETLQLGAPTSGARSYLVPYQSPLPSSCGLVATPVRRGDMLDGGVRPHVLLGEQPRSLSHVAIRVVLGPQHPIFDVASFLDAEWEIGLAADRTGLRLSGPQVNTREPWGDRPSEPQVTGTIQITSGGTPIVIGPDGPTIGGYPKIAVVIDADRDRLGQVKPGDRLRFRQIEIDDARALRREYHARLRQAFAARS